MALRILQYSDLENAHDVPERIGRLAGLIHARRDGRTLLAGTRDDLAPGVLSPATGGRQALDFFGAVDAVLDGHAHDPVAERVDGTVLARPDGDGGSLLAVGFGGDPRSPTTTRRTRRSRRSSRTRSASGMPRRASRRSLPRSRSRSLATAGPPTSARAGSATS